MACQKCESDPVRGAFYRWKNANVEIVACPDHWKEIQEILNWRQAHSEVFVAKGVSDSDLDILIEGLQEYKDDGVVDHWVLEGGRTIEPLDVLRELKSYRSTIPTV